MDNSFKQYKPIVKDLYVICFVVKPNFFEKYSGCELIERIGIILMKNTTKRYSFVFEAGYKENKELVQAVSRHAGIALDFEDIVHDTNIDLIITFGGDGSIMWANKMFAERDIPPLITFNSGNVGFLTKFECEHLDKVITKLKSSFEGGAEAPFFQIPLYKLSGIISNKHSQQEIGRVISINEIYIDRINSYSNNYDIFVNDNFIVTVNCDGIIVCSQAGSTAYNGSANGPFLLPGNDCIIITPVAPFAINMRSLVLKKDSVIKIRISSKNYGSEVKVIGDSNSIIRLTKEDEIEIRLKNSNLNFLDFEEDQTRQWIKKVSDLYKWA